MRARVWLPCLILLAMCALLYWHKRVKPNNPIVGETATPSNAVAVSPQIQRPKAPVNGQLPTTGSLPLTAVGTAAATNEANAAYQKTLTTWQAPIDFYGKVVDEKSNAVTGAQISFHWVETPDASGNRDSKTTSDANGFFELHDAHGPSLAVSVGKEGYYSSIEKDHPPFKYGIFAMGGFSPDAYNPVVFHLHTKGKGVALIQTSFPQVSDRLRNYTMTGLQ